MIAPALPPIDVAIITIKPEEYTSVTRRLHPWTTLPTSKHTYIHKQIAAANGTIYTVAVARTLEQGTNSAQAVAEHLVSQLRPKWLFLVGIAGGVPGPEYSLGDVLLCTRLHDFSVCCVLDDQNPTFSVRGGPAHPRTRHLLEILPAYEHEFQRQGWNSYRALRAKRPRIDLSASSLQQCLYGDPSWRADVEASLGIHFSNSRRPKYVCGPAGSSDRLVKSTSTLDHWRTFARDLTHVEMELGGVYLVGHEHDTPVVSVRGLSDIVGYRRSHDWTFFACHAAASFALSLIKSGLLDLADGTSGDHGPQPSVSPTSQIHGATSTAFNGPSPFHTFGTIPPLHQSYIARRADRALASMIPNYRFIAIHGDYQCGKCSLSVRHSNWLPTNWHFFRPRLDQYGARTVARFEAEFFEELRFSNKNVKNWPSMRQLVERHKYAFVLDEVATCATSVAAYFLTKLFALAEEFPEDIRIVMTCNQPIDIYMESIGFDRYGNSKYFNCWQCVRLGRFDEDEVRLLAKLLPAEMSHVIERYTSGIRRATDGQPQRVQNLFSAVWDECAGRDVSDRDFGSVVETCLSRCADR